MTKHFCTLAYHFFCVLSRLIFLIAIITWLV